MNTKPSKIMKIFNYIYCKILGALKKGQLSGKIKL